MATISPRSRTRRPATSAGGTNGQAIPELHNGDRLTQKEFHRRYEAYPEHVKIELIGGIVYMASPARRRHGKPWYQLIHALGLYEESTPSVDGLVDVTTILGDASEPQPDLMLRILPECGGRSRTDEDDYIRGAPEWLGQIAYSTERLDLGSRRADYERAGVREYLVVCVGAGEVQYFDLARKRKIKPSADGLYHSRVFPGLWIDAAALLEENLTRLLKGIRRGLASPEHAAFVKKLEAARRKKK